MSRGAVRAALSFVIVVGGVCFACGDHTKERKSERLSLREHVWLECAGLHRDLTRSAETYEELAPTLEDKDPGTPDYRAVVDHLARASVGYTPEVRGAKLQEIQRRFAFCYAIRITEIEHRDKVGVRLAKLLERAYVHGLNGETRSARQVVDALIELAALAKEINELPLVE
jgi:hypothetical protein